jgi:metal-responsive CopG/Arc/MetJ family transcriptional regulator
METLCVKIEKGLARDLNKIIGNHRYSTKTEFVREAIRDKIQNIETRNALLRLEEFYGSSKRKTTDKQLREVRKQTVKDFARELGVKL